MRQFILPSLLSTRVIAVAIERGKHCISFHVGLNVFGYVVMRRQSGS